MIFVKTNYDFTASTLPAAPNQFLGSADSWSPLFLPQVAPGAIDILPCWGKAGLVFDYSFPGCSLHRDCSYILAIPSSRSSAPRRQACSSAAYRPTSALGERVG